MKSIIKRHLKTLLLSGVFLTAVSCSVLEESTSASNTTASTSSDSPVLSDSNVAVASNFRTTTITEGLERPWGMAWLPDGSILITERPGRLRIVRNGVLDLEPIAGVPQVFCRQSRGFNGCFAAS